MAIVGFRPISQPGDVMRLVRWEQRWAPMVVGDENWEELHLDPIVWEWTFLDVSNPKRIEYKGPVFAWVPTVIEQTKLVPPPWPKDAPTETEFVRRARIRVLRRACHVDAEKAAEEPQWVMFQAHNVVADTKVLEFSKRYGHESAGFNAAA